jgi:2-methylcitrate dehydratase PrpD
LSSETLTGVVSRYVSGMAAREIDEGVLDEARKCLVDWVAVCLAAQGGEEARILRRVVEGWRAQGQAPLLCGGSTTAGLAALYHGTLSHGLDFDDTHIPSVIHVSGPVWAAVLAAGMARGVDERRMLRSFVTGFEVAARLGDGGVGVRLNQGGWHATPVLGRFGAASAVAAAWGLDEGQVSHALSLCGTQASGMTVSFGTMGKPLHAGKSALDAVLSVELAEAGYRGAEGILDERGRYLATLLQDPAARFAWTPFDAGWEIRRNSFKPYAACQLAHAAITGAHRVRSRIAGRRVVRIDAYVHPLAITIAGVKGARTPTEGKFSTAFCIALALAGHAVATGDFSEARLLDPALQDVASRVEMHAEDGIERTATRLEIELADGEKVVEDVKAAFGSIDAPMDWDALDGKFIALTEPLLGNAAGELLQLLHRFEERGSAQRLFALARPMSRDTSSLRAVGAPRP